MSKDYNHLKVWITDQCKKANLPVYKVANRAGLARATLYAWMNDTFRPDSDSFLKLAQVLAKEQGVKSEDLFAEGLRQFTPRVEGRPKGATIENGAMRPRRGRKNG